MERLMTILNEMDNTALKKALGDEKPALTQHEQLQFNKQMISLRDALIALNAISYLEEHARGRSKELLDCQMKLHLNQHNRQSAHAIWEKIDWIDKIFSEQINALQDNQQDNLAQKWMTAKIYLGELSLAVDVIMRIPHEELIENQIEIAIEIFEQFIQDADQKKLLNYLIQRRLLLDQEFDFDIAIIYLKKAIDQNLHEKQQDSFSQLLLGEIEQAKKNVPMNALPWLTELTYRTAFRIKNPTDKNNNRRYPEIAGAIAKRSWGKGIALVLLGAVLMTAAVFSAVVTCGVSLPVMTSLVACVMTKLTAVEVVGAALAFSLVGGGALITGATLLTETPKRDSIRKKAMQFFTQKKPLASVSDEKSMDHRIMNNDH